MLTKTLLCTALSMAFCMSVNAADLSVGDPKSDLGELSVSGFLRAKYQDKDWSSNDHKLTFDAARINLDYASPHIFGHVEYRCYQFSKLCDFAPLVDSYVGYKFNENNQVQVGLQTVPFGPARFWESNNYGGVVTQIGLEDVHNLGASYKFKATPSTTLDLAYFNRDGGSYHGSSKDSSRYTSNYVQPEDSSQTYLQEKNMWVGRISQDLPLHDQHWKSSVGASYWASDIENKTNGLEGSRKAWSVFTSISYDQLALSLVGGQNKVNNKDPMNPNTSVMGSFDDNYLVANKGNFYTADLSYKFEHVGKLDAITLYGMYSKYQKSVSEFKDSERNILGMSIDYKKLTFITEYIMGKNDFLIGGTGQSYAAGDATGRNNLLNLQMIYHF